MLDPINPKPSMIKYDDIISGLSNKTRYNGQSLFYSVAEHSVLLCDFLQSMSKGKATPGVLLNLLMHDAAEAYLPDVPTPIKQLFPGFKAVEKVLLKMIFRKFGIPYLENFQTSKDGLKLFDRSIVLNERAALMPNHPEGQSWFGGKYKPLDGVVIKRWTPEQAADEFTTRFKTLLLRMNENV